MKNVKRFLAAATGLVLLAGCCLPAFGQGPARARLDLRRGKIIRQVNYFDPVSFLRQMGFFDQLGK